MTARRESAAVLLLIAAVSWTAQFHHFRDFGLYEDDYWFISQAMSKDPSYLVARFVKVFTTLPQGRPFGFFLPDLLSWVGDRLGGLPAIYLVGFGVVVLNTFLFYKLLRVRTPALVATIGGLAFCLFAADTTKFLLIHDFQLQPSLTFVLLASLAYAAGRKPVAYVLCVASLLAYENGFPPFLALPLLLRRWDRRVLWELVRHAAILTVIVVAVVGLRFLVGEGRATGSVGGLADIVPKVIGGMAIGPVRVVAMFAYGPLKAVPGWNAETVLLATGCGIALAGLFQRWRPQPPGPQLREAVELGAAGAVMLCLAYALAFTHFPPTAVVGRGTSVHLGATLGGSVLVAAAAWMLLRRVRPSVAAPLLAGYFALAIGYQLTIAQDFQRSWQIQRAFWQQVDACCSDLDERTVLLYELNPTGPETTFIFTNSWADALVLDQTFRFPAEWTQPPRLFSLTQWRSRVQADGEQLKWWVPAASWDEHWETLPQGNVILLRRDGDGRVSRVTGAVDVPGGTLRLKEPAPPVRWPPAQLHDLLLNGQ